MDFNTPHTRITEFDWNLDLLSLFLTITDDYVLVLMSKYKELGKTLLAALRGDNGMATACVGVS